VPADTTAAKSYFVLTPWMDEYTLDFALAGVRATGLGRGPAPDILAVSLSTTDAIGHTWGPDSREIHDQIVRLDRELGGFLDALARLRDPRRTVVVLTADHGVTPFAGWARSHGYPLADNVSFDSLILALRDSLVQRAGSGSWVRFWDLGLLVLDRRGLGARGVNVDSVVDALATTLRADHAVQRVDTPASLAAADTAQDAIARRWLKSVPPGIGAELMVTLKPMYSLGSARSAEHGQPTDDDTHVPLLFWGAGIRTGTHTQRVSVTDIAPTLARLLGVAPLEALQGRVLAEALVGR
jgi:predicted AlkP superfamily pyrophosphatase or phosphodiesterase